jgi:hypothetical protein
VTPSVSCNPGSPRKRVKRAVFQGIFAHFGSYASIIQRTHSYAGFAGRLGVILDVQNNSCEKCAPAIAATMGIKGKDLLK